MDCSALEQLLEGSLLTRVRAGGAGEPGTSGAAGEAGDENGEGLTALPGDCGRVPPRCYGGKGPRKVVSITADDQTAEPDLRSTIWRRRGSSISRPPSTRAARGAT